MIIRTILKAITLVIAFSFYMSIYADQQKVLLFSGRGGGGHLVTAHVIKGYLEPKYDVRTAFIFDEILKESDLIYRATWGRIHGEELWNILAQKKLYTVLNAIYDLGILTFKLQEPTIEKALMVYLEHMRPDLIISVIPVVNNAILQVAEQLNIPFIVIPTDLDPSMALRGIYNPQYAKFKLGLAYDIPDINDRVASFLIPKDKIAYVGFPVKKCFFDKEYCQSIEAEFAFPQDKPLILLLMGAQGSIELYNYAWAFTKVKVPVHLAIAIGRSEHLRAKIETLKFPPNVTYTIIGFTDKIPELMQKADLFISKAGGVSVNEAIYANLPMLLDATSSLLRWEKFNLGVVVQHKFGQAVKRLHSYFFSDLPSTIDRMFRNKAMLQTYKNNLVEFKKPNPYESITTLVNTVIAT